MILRSLQLVGFRNFINYHLSEINPKYNLIVGPNGYGKSNLLESIYLNTWANSSKTRSLAEAIHWGEEMASVDGIWEKDEYRVSITKSQKSMYLNRQLIGFNKFVEQRSIVLFQPSDLGLLNNSPSNRRRFINRLVAQLDVSYLSQLHSLNQLLSQRNHAFRINVSNTVLDSLEEQLAEIGAKIFYYRAIMITYLNRRLKENQLLLEYQITSSRLREILRELLREIEAKSQNSSFYEVVLVFGEYEVVLRELLQEILREMREKEREIGFTLVGPQRDDLILSGFDTKFPNQWKNLGKFGSRGEQRMGIIALKLGEAQMLSIVKSTPVLLLDDILSELDNNNRKHIFDHTQNYQTFIATTENDLIIPADSPQISRINLLK